MDELDPRDLQAWRVQPLCADFEDSVLAAIEREPTTLLASSSVDVPRSRSRRWPWPASAAAVTALAASLAVVWSSSAPTPTPTPPSLRGAASASLGDTRVRLEPGVVAQLGPGAAIAWEAKPERLFVEHTEGQVRYEVRPGTPVSVHTPAGVVEVIGTRFSVEVIAMSESNAGRIKTLVPVAAAGVAAVAIVAVTQGSVDARNDHGTAAVAADERAVMTDVSAPQLRPPEPKAEPAERPTTVAKAPKPSEVRRQHAETRERIRQALQRRGEAERTEAEDTPLKTEVDGEYKGKLSKDYIRDAVREDLIPLAQECYSDRLEADPEFGGKLVLEFDIMGDEDVGGIVDDVQTGEGTELLHPDFVECMSESMMTVRFAAPEGGGMVHVTYPMLFEPE